MMLKNYYQNGDVFRWVEFRQVIYEYWLINPFIITVSACHISTKTDIIDEFIICPHVVLKIDITTKIIKFKGVIRGWENLTAVLNLKGLKGTNGIVGIFDLWGCIGIS